MKLGKIIRAKHTIQTPDSFDIDEIFNDCITNHKQKFHLYPVIYDFLLVFDREISPYFISDL